MKKVIGFTEQQVIDFVINHDDGYEYAQLQTGISRHDLDELMVSHGVYCCFYCDSYFKRTEDEPSPVPGLTYEMCTRCAFDYRNEGWL